LREDPVDTLGKTPADDEVEAVAGVADLGTIDGFGIVVPAVAVLAFEFDLVEPFPIATFAAGVGLLLVSVLRFRLTVFFLIVVDEPVFFESVLPFFMTLDLPPPPTATFFFVVLPRDAVEFGLLMVAEDTGLGGGAIPNNRSSSNTLSSWVIIVPPNLENLIRFD